jgi:hypothetical protein
MNMNKLITFIMTHGIALAIGFAAGIYALPILTAPTAPTVAEVAKAAESANYKAKFKRDLKDSDALHYGEGTVTISAESISLMGKLAPGPNYKLYLSPEFVETESEFLRLKSTMVVVSDIKTFDNFLVKVPATINPSQYSSVIIWCEAFGQFITAAQYQ